jgi:hypothetical protein
MATLIYRCPATRLKVQGWFADEAPPTDAFEAVKVLGLYPDAPHKPINRPGVGQRRKVKSGLRGRRPLCLAEAASRGPGSFARRRGIPK